MEEIGKIGVLIPTFNRRHYLSTALDSALGQTYGELEIIVIDNCSTDGTSNFMAGIADARVRYIVNDHNMGMIGSINKGINLFSDQVEWCTILADDDLMGKECIENCARSLKASSAKSIIQAHRIFIDEQGSRIREAAFFPRNVAALDFLRMRSRFEMESYLTGVLFNRTSFREIRGYPSFITGLASDDAFIFALALKDRLVFEEKAQAFIRLHEGAESRTYSDGIRKLDTIAQFKEYCLKVAQESRIFDKGQFKEFEAILRRYVRALNSIFWVKTAHTLLAQKDMSRGQLASLFTIVKRNWDHFTFRVKLDYFIQKFTGILPEQLVCYRSFWMTMIKTAHRVSKLTKGRHDTGNHSTV